MNKNKWIFQFGRLILSIDKIAKGAGGLEVELATRLPASGAVGVHIRLSVLVFAQAYYIVCIFV